MDVSSVHSRSEDQFRLGSARLDSARFGIPSSRATHAPSGGARPGTKAPVGVGSEPMDPGITLRARGLARVVAPASSVAQVEVKLSNGSHAQEPEPGSGAMAPLSTLTPWPRAVTRRHHDTSKLKGDSGHFTVGNPAGQISGRGREALKSTTNRLELHDQRWVPSALSASGLAN